ncbi:zinc-finger homeodomain protein 4-like [Salvia hispanica]|uniref:zinc-finger homeodomain protein 4-like n=1 Tax=Salvia hispanica TaxID=49212 RepID=UPI002009944E|nr:zinc-finger homeodomain protein 4-like [Salvia hispanica]
MPGEEKNMITIPTYMFMECLKNHAIAIGRSATDGCGEFMAGGEEGTLEAFNCAACVCHQNFHRKVEVPPPVREGAKKRFRTKFTKDQKEKMRLFAHKNGWKIYNAGDAEVRSFCEEIGVSRKVLKVWMHNHKADKLPAAADAATATA